MLPKWVFIHCSVWDRSASCLPFHFLLSSRLERHRTMASCVPDMHLHLFCSIWHQTNHHIWGQEQECSLGCSLSVVGCRMLPETTILCSQLLSCSDLRGWDVPDAVTTFPWARFTKKASFPCYPEAVLARHSRSSWFCSHHSQLRTSSCVVTRSHFAKLKIYHRSIISNLSGAEVPLQNQPTCG